MAAEWIACCENRAEPGFWTGKDFSSQMICSWGAKYTPICPISLQCEAYLLQILPTPTIPLCLSNISKMLIFPLLNLCL